MTRLTQDVAAQLLTGFLVDRLAEDLAALWARDAARPPGWTGPGLAAQVEVLDDLLTTLRDGRLPDRSELRLLFVGYGDHPAYDPRWVRLLLE
jgi:hypothetical protein